MAVDESRASMTNEGSVLSEANAETKMTAAGLPAADARGTTLRAELLRLVALSILPLLLTSIGLIYHLFVQQREAADQGVLSDAISLSATVDTEAMGWRLTAETFARTALAGAFDLREAYDAARQVTANQPGTRIGLVARGGQQLFCSDQPFDATLGNVFARAGASDDAAAIEREQDNLRGWGEVFDGKAGYSNLYLRGADGSAAVGFRLPIRRGELVAYALVVSAEPRRFARLLQRREPPGRTATILDRRNAVLARSPIAERAVGTLAPEAFAAHARDRAAGVYRGVSGQGAAVVSAFARSEQTGWLLWTGQPTAAADRAMRRSTLVWSAIMLLLVGVSLAGARHLWRRVGEPLGQLAANAAAFERGEAVIVPRSPIRELRDCGRAWSLAVQAERARLAQERQLIAAETRQREAEQASREKDRVLAALGHELRNPLGAISNGVHVLETAGLSGTDARMVIGIIRRQCAHLGGLVDNLVDLASATFGRMRLAREPVALHALVRAVVAQAQRDPAPRPTIELDLQQQVWVDGDPQRLTQALRQVLDNAIRFTPASGTVAVALRCTADTATVQVDDTGQGIAPQVLGRLFMPFIQSEQSLERARGGLGLGLALVREIVRLHGGQVSAASAGRGQGTQITIALPLLSRTEPPVAKGADAVRSADGGHTSRDH